MLTRQELFDKLRELLPELQQRFGVEKIGVFGSFARGDANEESDIDVLVIYRDRPQGWSYFSLAPYLEGIFNKKVDLTEPHLLRDRIRDRVLQQVKYV
ncbi:MAG: nucleotidyltransferase family protein [Leeuwenhoekiella sp.]